MSESSPQLDDLRTEYVRQWLGKAKTDLAAAKLSIENGLPGVGVYHCQQAAEKTMKAFLVSRDIRPPKSHNLSDLHALVGVLPADLETVFQPAHRLTDYAWRFRYPGDVWEPEMVEANDALHCASDLYGVVIQAVPEAARPA